MKEGRVREGGTERDVFGWKDREGRVRMGGTTRMFQGGRDREGLVRVWDREKCFCVGGTESDVSAWVGWREICTYVCSGGKKRGVFAWVGWRGICLRGWDGEGCVRIEGTERAKSGWKGQ